MKKRIQKLQFPFGIMLAGLLLLSASLLKVPVAALQNRMMEDFVRSEQESKAQIPAKWADLPYSTGVEMGKILFPIYGFECLTANSKTLKQSQFSRTPSPTVSLESPVCYYRDRGESPPVMTIQAGEPCMVGSLGKQYEFTMQVGFGVITLPTQDPQWRYAVPLRYADVEKPVYQELYFVRTEDIRSIWRQCEEQNPGIERYANTLIRAELETSRHSSYSYTDLLYWVDSQLYGQGIYLSPNLLRPLWDHWNTGLACSGVVLLGAGLLSKAALKRRGRPSKTEAG